MPDSGSTLRRWAILGTPIARLARVPVDWQPAARVIRAATPLLKVQVDRLLGLLKSSDRFPGLRDPLLDDFGTHRWLRADREEAYSDWLHWVLERLGDSDRILRVLDVPEALRPARPERVTIEREKYISGGRRLDLVVKLESIIVVVEVKMGSADAPEANIDKQEFYHGWVTEERFQSFYTVLIAKDGDRDRLYGGFRLLTWRRVAFTLRDAAVALCADNGHGRDVVGAAMTLAFVGAIEQNLLKLPGGLSRRPWRYVASAAGRVLSYLIGQEAEMAKTSDARHQLFGDGLKDYPMALLAIGEFHKSVIAECKTVLEKVHANLAKVLETKLAAVSDEPYPRDLKDFDGRAAWLGAKIDVQGLGSFYAGLSWDPELPVEENPVPCAGFYCDKKGTRDELVHALRSNGASDVEEHDYSEMFIIKKPPIEPTPGAYGAALKALCDRRIEIWPLAGDWRRITARRSS